MRPTVSTRPEEREQGERKNQGFLHRVSRPDALKRAPSRPRVISPLAAIDTPSPFDPGAAVLPLPNTSRTHGCVRHVFSWR